MPDQDETERERWSFFQKASSTAEKAAPSALTCRKDWTIRSTEPIADDKMVVRVNPEKTVAIAEHPDLPGAQVLVAVDRTSMTRTIDVQVLAAKNEARSALMNRFCKQKLGVRVDAPRRTEVRVRHVVRGLVEKLLFSEVGIVGWPRVFEHVKSKRQLVLCWNDDDVIPDIALEGLAAASGVSLLEFETAIGLTLAREIVSAQAKAIAAVEQRQVEEERRRVALAEAEHAKQKAKEAAERAATTKAEADRLEALAARGGHAA